MTQNPSTTFDTIVFIGRFQPFHQGHAHIIEQALQRGQMVVVIVGSAYSARSTKNPFTLQERIEMMTDYFHTQYPHDHQRIVFEGVEDRYYNEIRWLNDVTQAVLKHHSKGNIAIIGHEKDRSSYYLKSFPNFSWLHIDNYHNINATHIRAQFLTQRLFQDPSTLAQLPDSIQAWLKKFEQRPEFSYLCEYYHMVTAYIQAWSVAPYPVVLVTVDALVVCQNHVLLIKRGNHPGKGFFAMPGGYLDPSEWVRDGIIRELIEETKIQLAPETLRSCLLSMTVFDHPDRSEAGRKITHVGHIHLPQQTLPPVLGSDDALTAQWFNIQDLPAMKDQFHADHYPIINQFLSLD